MNIRGHAANVLCSALGLHGVRRVRLYNINTSSVRFKTIIRSAEKTERKCTSARAHNGSGGSIYKSTHAGAQFMCPGIVLAVREGCLFSIDINTGRCAVRVAVCACSEECGVIFALQRRRSGQFAIQFQTGAICMHSTTCRRATGVGHDGRRPRLDAVYPCVRIFGKYLNRPGNKCQRFLVRASM